MIDDDRKFKYCIEGSSVCGEVSNDNRGSGNVSLSLSLLNTPVNSSLCVLMETMPDCSVVCACI